MTETNQELWDLLQRVADDRLDDDAAQRLEQLLLAEPAARHVYAEFMLLDAELALEHTDAISFSPGHDDTKRHRPGATRHAAAKRHRWPMVGISLAVVVATAMMTLFIFSLWQAADVPRIQQIEGAVHLVISGEANVAVALGESIPSGTTVVTADEAVVVLQYRDGTLLHLRPDSRLQIEDRKRLFLATGLLEASVARQERSPMIIRTPHAEIEVLGTEFVASAESQATRVELLDGHVDVVRLVDGKSVQLHQGQYAVAGQSADALTPRPLPTRLTTPAVEIRHPDDALAFCPAGDLLVAVDKEKIRLWKPDLNKQVGQLHGHREKVLCLSFDADGRLLASGTDDPFVAIWDVPERQMLQRIEVGEPGILALALSPDGHRLASVDIPGNAPNLCRVHLWDVSTGNELPPLSAKLTAVTALAFSPDGQHLAAGTRTGGVVVWNTASGEQVAMHDFEASRVVDVAFLQDATQLIICRQQGVAELLDAQSLQIKRSWRRPEERFRRMQVSPDGHMLAIGTSSGVVRLWDRRSGQEVAVVEVDDIKGVRSLSFSPDGRKLLAGAGHRVAIWDLDEVLLAFADVEDLEADDRDVNDEQQRQFDSLFNGRDLTGWIVEKEGSFSVRDGVIHMDGRGGWLRSEKQYQDFELRLEFRFAERGADSGIFLRYHPEGGYQVQTCIQDRWGEVRPRKREEMIQQTHNTDHVKALVKMNKTEPDAWHTYRIVLRGNRAVVYLDGKLATDATGLKTKTGFIGLQGERPTIQFRNINIHDLSN